MGKYDDLFSAGAPEPKSKYQDLLDVPSAPIQSLPANPTAPQVSLSSAPIPQSLYQSGSSEAGPNQFGHDRTVGEILPRGVGLAARAAGGPGLAAGIGSIVPGVGTAAGLGTYAATRLLYDPVAGMYNGVRPDSWPQAPTTSDLVTHLADALDLPKPEGSGERILSTGVGAMADYGGMNSLGKMLQFSQNPIAKGTGEALTHSPVTQTVLSGAGGATAEALHESGVNLDIPTPLGPIPLTDLIGNALPAVLHGAATSWTGKPRVTEQSQANAARILQTAAGADSRVPISEVVNNFRPSSPDTNYQPTLGTESGNLGLLAVQKALVNDGTPFTPIEGGGQQVPSVSMARTAVGNAGATNELINKALAPELSPGAGAPEELQIAAQKAIAPDPAEAQLRQDSAAQAQLQRNELAQAKAKADAEHLTRQRAAEDALQKSAAERQQKLAEAKAQADAEVQKAQADAELERQNTLAPVRQTAAEARTAAEEAQSKLRTQQEDLSASASSDVRAAQSTAADAALSENHAAAKTEASALYAKVPKDVTIALDEAAGGVTLNKANEIRNQIAESGGAVPPEVNRIIDLVGGTADTPPNPLTARGAQDLLSDLHTAARELPKDSTARGHLNALAEALDSDMSRVAEFSAPLAEARTYYRENVVPLFKEGASGRVLLGQTSTGGRRIEAGKSLDTYLSGNSKAEAQRLRDALTGAPSAGGVRTPIQANHIETVTKYLESKFADAMGTNATPEKAQTWLNRNSQTLEAWPEVKARLQERVDALTAIHSFANETSVKATSAADTFKQTSRQTAAEVKAKAAEVKAKAEKDLAEQSNLSKEELNRQRIASKRQVEDQRVSDLKNLDALKAKVQASSPTGSANSVDPALRKLATGDPVEAIEGMLGGSSPARDLTRLAALAKDSPRALEGLRNATKQAINELVRAKTAGLLNEGGASNLSDLPVTQAKLNDLFAKGSSTRRGLEAVMSKEDLALIDQARAQVTAADKINLKVTSGSDTIQGGTNLTTLQELAQVGDLAKILDLGGTKVKTTAKLLKFAGNKLLSGGLSVEDATRELLLRAQTDSRLAKILLTRPTEASLPQLQVRLAPIVEGIAANKSVESDSKNQ